MVEKIKKIAYSRYLPYILYAALMIALHIVIKTDFGDDIIFAQALSKRSLIPYLIHRYNTWSSRLIIEVCMVTLPHAVMLWKIIDVAVMVWIAAAFSLFFNREKRLLVDWYIILMMMSYPFAAMATAGWIATTVNYSWCVALGLLSFVPARNVLVEKKTPWYLYVAACFGLLYSASHEQMCAIMAAVCAILGIYQFYKTKKVHWYIALQFTVALGGLIFILTCPGNENRTAIEIQQWFPEFAQFSLLHKIELGYSRAMYEFVMKQNILYMLFCATLAYGVFVYNKNKFLRFVSSIPFVVSLLMGPFVIVVEKRLPALEQLRKALTETGSGFLINDPTTWLPVLFVTAIAVCIMASLWAIFKNTSTTLFSIAILGVGLASAVVMGLSPTVWASRERTFMFMYMAFAAIGIVVFSHIQKAQKSSTKGAAIIYCAAQTVFALDMYLNLFLAR